MIATELKEIIKSQIDEINYEVILDEINTLSNNKKSNIINLNKAVIDDILVAEHEIKNGLGIDNDQLDCEIEKWLTEK